MYQKLKNRRTRSSQGSSLMDEDVALTSRHPGYKKRALVSYSYFLRGYEDVSLASGDALWTTVEEMYAANKNLLLTPSTHKDHMPLYTVELKEVDERTKQAVSAIASTISYESRLRGSSGSHERDDEGEGSISYNWPWPDRDARQYPCSWRRNCHGRSGRASNLCKSNNDKQTAQNIAVSVTGREPSYSYCGYQPDRNVPSRQSTDQRDVSDMSRTSSTTEQRQSSPLPRTSTPANDVSAVFLQSCPNSSWNGSSTLETKLEKVVLNVSLPLLPATNNSQSCSQPGKNSTDSYTPRNSCFFVNKRYQTNKSWRQEPRRCVPQPKTVPCFPVKSHKGCRGIHSDLQPAEKHRENVIAPTVVSTVASHRHVSSVEPSELTDNAGSLLAFESNRGADPSKLKLNPDAKEFKPSGLQSYTPPSSEEEGPDQEIEEGKLFEPVHRHNERLAYQPEIPIEYTHYQMLPVPFGPAYLNQRLMAVNSVAYNHVAYGSHQLSNVSTAAHLPLAAYPRCHQQAPSPSVHHGFPVAGQVEPFIYVKPPLFVSHMASNGYNPMACPPAAFPYQPMIPSPSFMCVSSSQHEFFTNQFF